MGSYRVPCDSTAQSVSSAATRRLRAPRTVTPGGARPAGEDTDRPILPCRGCREQVPLSEASIAEAVDYIIHFCGLECYARWAEEQQKPDPCSGGVVASLPNANGR